jgi:purine-cytosine permease-like protein
VCSRGRDFEESRTLRSRGSDFEEAGEERGDGPLSKLRNRRTRGGGVPGVDTVGHVEHHGIDYIPEAERHSRPANIVWILVGGSITLSVIVIGWVPITLGLGWWSSVTAIVAGALAGALLLAPMSLMAPRTGTNNPVSSGAHFGVIGRCVGSLLGLFGALAFAALSVWTGGDALIAGAAKLIGTPDTDIARAIGYGVIASVITYIAVLGHSSMLAVQKVMVPTVGVLMIIGIAAFGGGFDAGYEGGGYALGSFWPTWALAALASCSTVSSYGPFVGDWARYISAKKYSNASLVAATGFGSFFGLGIPMLFGTYTASVFSDPSQAYVPGLVAASPLWYVPAIMLMGLVAGTAQGVINMYGTGLDMSSIVPKLNRVKATLTVGVIAFALVYLGNFVWNAVDSVSSFLAVLSVIVTPWILINAIGYWYRRGFYDPDDLQVFNRGEKGGRYWFTGGYNLRAFFAWLPASATGLLFSNTTFYTGPGATWMNGVDVGFIVAGIIASVLYLIALVVAPEPAEALGPCGARLGKHRVSGPSAPVDPLVAPSENGV